MCGPQATPYRRPMPADPSSSMRHQWNRKQRLDDLLAVSGIDDSIIPDPARAYTDARNSTLDAESNYNNAIRDKVLFGNASMGATEGVVDMFLRALQSARSHMGSVNQTIEDQTKRLGRP